MFNATIIVDAVSASQSPDAALSVIGNVYLLPVAMMIALAFAAMIVTACLIVKQGAFKIAVILAMGLVVVAVLFYLTFILPVIPKILYDLSGYVIF